jgi:hypothetical protein
MQFAISKIIWVINILPLVKDTEAELSVLPDHLKGICTNTFGPKMYPVPASYESYVEFDSLNMLCFLA